ncbi:hypothetical protein OCU04_005002 [Sclerotinia nivalis]|uniref:Uncharacterized protein n=1 Tax=Sclerotinia nivalis TaxID=352851 RepID=A0A9X0AN75_9HELO|nr:hypothetical protein OCU04_005002 [Sclerotinia nivalis]
MPNNQTVLHANAGDEYQDLLPAGNSAFYQPHGNNDTAPLPMSLPASENLSAHTSNEEYLYHDFQPSGLTQMAPYPPYAPVFLQNDSFLQNWDEVDFQGTALPMPVHTQQDLTSNQDRSAGMFPPTHMNNNDQLYHNLSLPSVPSTTSYGKITYPLYPKESSIQNWDSFGRQGKGPIISTHPSTHPSSHFGTLASTQSVDVINQSQDHLEFLP